MVGITTTADKLCVRVSQLAPAPAEIDANVATHLTQIEAARAAGVDVLVFPELSLTGYLVGPLSPTIGMSQEDPRLLALARASGPMRTVVGFVEEGFAAQFFCSAAVLRDGEVVFVHRKLNLANYGDMQEAKYFATGRYVETFPLSGRFVGGLMLCADMWNPPLVHLAALHGCTLLLVPTNSSLDSESGDFSKPGRWDVVLRFYASLYGMPIAFCNRVGEEGAHRFWGGSRIIGPDGVALVRAEGEETAHFTATIDYQDVRQARFDLPTVRDSNLALIHRELTRLVDRIGVPDAAGRW